MKRGMDTDLFDYVLPEELIAQRPAEKRDRSRMLVLHRESGECDTAAFCDNSGKEHSTRGDDAS